MFYFTKVMPDCFVHEILRTKNKMQHRNIYKKIFIQTITSKKILKITEIKQAAKLKEL